MATSSHGARGSPGRGRRPAFSYPVELAPASELPPVPPTAAAPPQMTARTRAASRAPHLQYSSPWGNQAAADRPRATNTTAKRNSGAAAAPGTKRTADTLPLREKRGAGDTLTADWEPPARAMWRRLGALQDAATEARAKERSEARAQAAGAAAATLMADTRRRVQEERARNQALRQAAMARRPPPSEATLDAWMSREETRLAELEYLAELRAQKMLEEVDEGNGSQRPLRRFRRRHRLRFVSRRNPLATPPSEKSSN